MEYSSYPEYKKCDVEWIVDIPIHWIARKVTHGFCRIGSGTTPKSDNPKYYGGDIPWVTTSELREKPIHGTKIKITKKALNDYSTLKLYEKGSLIIAMYGATIGRLGILEMDATANQACCVFAEPEYFYVKYFYYWLWMRRPILISLSVGGGQPNLSQDDLKQIRAPIPPVEEQQKIADFLDYKTQQIDQLIEKKKALIEKLNEQRIAVITQAVTKGIDKNAKMKPSGVDWLGDVPEHWEVRPLKFVATYNDESLPETTDPDKEISYVDISSVNHVDGITKNDLTTFEKAPSRARRIVKDGDTIISTVRTYLKAIAAIKKPPENMIVSTGFAVIRASKIIDATFLSFFLSSQKFIETVVANSKGVSYPAINASELACIHIAFPENKLEQKSIVNHIEKAINKVDKMFDLNIKTMDRLKEYRSSLITAAVTGKIDIRHTVIPAKAGIQK